jgi:hypothetical protein
MIAAYPWLGARAVIRIEAARDARDLFVFICLIGILYFILLRAIYYRLAPSRVVFLNNYCLESRFFSSISDLFSVAYYPQAFCLLRRQEGLRMMRQCGRNALPAK